ncbi:MAG TPA: chemotaxis response regulator protein-glutamate methylesterase [Terriglobales bacterium]|nr:chemotaxis response regulator protein-glutamate methylesterase [Terriglobales bacterium]
MPPIRILIVDDSSLIRRVLSDELAKDPALAIAGMAANGRIALSKLQQVNPDLVILDVEMPVMDGLETLTEIRKTHPKLPVIMFSTLTERGAAITLDALARGATDYVTKPSNTGSLDASLGQINDQLIPRLKALCQPRAKLPKNSAPLGMPVQPRKFPAAVPSRVDILAIGTSTGGPNALAAVIPSIPANFPVPIVIVQHMPKVFTKLLAARLDSLSPLTIQEGQQGCPLKPGEAWLAPGDYHMTVQRQGDFVHLALNQDIPENSCRPAVDPLFRSVANTFGAHVLAVVLTGMGYDGVRGSQHVRENGGQVVVQDEPSSVVWGMPGQVVAAGLADGVYPLSSIAQEIVRRVGSQRIISTSSITGRLCVPDGERQGEHT